MRYPCVVVRRVVSMRTAMFLLGVILLVSVATAQDKPEVFAQLGHTDGVFSVAFSRDGRLA